MKKIMELLSCFNKTNSEISIATKIEAAEKHLANLKEKLNAKKTDLEGAEKWLKDYISKPFDVVHDLENETITYSRYGNVAFQQDLKNGYFGYGCYLIYSVLYEQYRIKDVDINEIIKEVVQKAFDCQGLVTYTKYNLSN